MDEWLIAMLALVFAVGLVWAIHRLIVGHVEIKSASGKAILGMDAVAIGILFVAFILGEVSAFAQNVKTGLRSHSALTWHDVRLVLGTLFASLLIFVAIDKLRKWGQ
jgi:hypothetical protein